MHRLYDLQKVHRYDLSICAVLLPGFLDELEPLMDWCFERGVMMSLSPQLVDRRVNDELRSDERYRALTARLLDYRRRGRPLYCTSSYFQGLHDLQPFECVPMANLGVGPMGRITSYNVCYTKLLRALLH